MTMLVRPLAAPTLLTITLSVSALLGTTIHIMSHSGRAPAIYLVRPGSSLSHQLGINRAPTADTADPFSHGYGADALAFRFNRAVILTAPPAYIVQATPNKFYTQRNAKAFFGQPQSIERRSDGFVAYYTIQAYNPSEDRSGRGGR